MISDNDLEKLAALSKLEVDPSIKPVVMSQVNSILGYVERLNTVDTSQVEAMSHTLEATNVLREDSVRPAGSQPESVPLGDTEIHRQAMLETKEMLANTPDHSGTFIRVPLIVE
jgi:aspartyl-tRNA(Asn)/glutamyl-tRNA(Gln) amidotransferase subunit C